MNTQTLGPSSLRVSALCYGGWRLAGSEGSPAVTSNEPGKRAVHAAVDAGYTFFDFADIYGGGRCERIFGEALRESPGLRDRLVVATKCGIRRSGEPDPSAPFRYDFDADHILSAVEGSLQRMGIETIDLLMLHRPDALMQPAVVAGAFAALKDAGKVREFGVSNFRPSQVTLLQRACPFPLVVNQVEISLLETSTLDDGTLDQCQVEGMTPMAWSPLGRGALVSEIQDTGSPKFARHQALKEVTGELASRRGVSRATIALAWLLRHPSGIIPIVGSSNPERIRELVQAETVHLTREEWYRLWETSRGARLP